MVAPEGANGHLPNLDLLNSASHILRTTGIPTVLHASDQVADNSSPTTTWPLVGTLLALPAVRVYVLAARHLLHQLRIGALGVAEGPEAVFGRYRIDAVTFFGVPADGPHGFHSIGR